MTIQRTGEVSFGDASLSAWEDGIAAARQTGGRDGAAAWEREFKRDVFARIVQQLNRLGWTCKIPEYYIKQYSRSFAEGYRGCHKGALKGLPIEAREITSRIILDACTPYEWTNKPNEIFMDRAVLQKVSDRWNEYGFSGTSPVAGMVNRLTRPQVKKAKGGK